MRSAVNRCLALHRRATNKCDFVIFLFPETLIIAEIINPAGFIDGGTGKIIESITFFLQLNLWQCDFSLCIKVCEDVIVLFQDPVNRVHHVV